MITGIGTDLVEIARVQKAADKESFLHRIFTDREQELIAERPVRVAGNFAAKEAVVKAFGCGFSGIHPGEIEILRDKKGAPYVVLHGNAKETAKALKIDRIHVSITDTAEFSQAFAVCEGEGEALKKKRTGFFPVVSSASMKEIDKLTIERERIPSIQLMEMAAEAVAKRVRLHASKQEPIAVLCGRGNNGGDGLAAARILKKDGYSVTILLENPEKNDGTMEFCMELEQAKEVSVPLRDFSETKEYTYIIDALFGIGLSRAVEGKTRQLIEQINREQHFVIAVDIPSGVSASTGEVLGAAVHANETVTFGAAKLGHLLYPGKAEAGSLFIEPLAFPRDMLWEKKDAKYLAQETAEKPCYESLPLMKRPAYSNKGTFGKVVIVAGSRNMAGAAYLSAYAAYRAGAGLVRIVTQESNREILQTKLPEAMLTTYSEDTDFRALAKESIAFADTLVIGPGLSTGETAGQLVEVFCEELRKLSSDAPITVFDADALNLLSQKRDKFEKQYEAGRTGNERIRLQYLNELLPETAILTPHLAELQRLLQIGLPTLQREFVSIAKQIAEQTSYVFVCKDAVTMVVKGDECFIQTAGNSGMATGGSGDVLSGIIAAFAARKDAKAEEKAFHAACMGVYFHGLAGDAAAGEKSETSVMAGDIAEWIGRVIEKEEILQDRD